jgi:SAM-dependent methyltransferase
MADTASQFVGGIPDFYHRGLGPVLFADWADEMARRALAGQPREVLELAAGTGMVSRRLAAGLPADARLAVTDLNLPMLEVARGTLGNDPRVSFAEVDATRLPFPDAGFDCVVCQFGVMFFPDRPAAYREARRVTRPGGRYLLSTWGPPSSNPFAEVVQETVARFFPGDPPGFYRVPFSRGDPAEVRRELEAAGWPQVEAQTLERTKTVADPEAFARAIVFGNPLLIEIRQRGGVDPDRVVDAILAGLVARFGRNPTTLPQRATIFSCTAE